MVAAKTDRINLNEIQVAAPCMADWDGMKGDDRARFCLQCRKNVYNLSDMTRGEAEAFVREKEGKVCVRFFRREDGTLLTDNCPMGLRMVRKSGRWVAWVFAASFSLIASSFAGAWHYQGLPPAPKTANAITTPPPPREVKGDMVMGKVCVNVPVPVPVAPPANVPPPAPPVAPNPTALVSVEEF